MWKFQITQKFADSCLLFSAGRWARICKFLGYLIFPNQSYKKWCLGKFKCHGFRPVISNVTVPQINIDIFHGNVSVVRLRSIWLYLVNTT